MRIVSTAGRVKIISANGCNGWSSSPAAFPPIRLLSPVRDVTVACCKSYHVHLVLMPWFQSHLKTHPMASDSNGSASIASSPSSSSADLSDEWQGWSDSPRRSSIQRSASKGDNSAGGRSHRSGGEERGGNKDTGMHSRGGVGRTRSSGGVEVSRMVSAGGNREQSAKSSDKKAWELLELEKKKLTRVRKPPPDWGTFDDSDD